jgi:hypothetical protein
LNHIVWNAMRYISSPDDRFEMKKKI